MEGEERGGGLCGFFSSNFFFFSKLAEGKSLGKSGSKKKYSFLGEKRHLNLPIVAPLHKFPFWGKEGEEKNFFAESSLIRGEGKKCSSELGAGLWRKEGGNEVFPIKRSTFYYGSSIMIFFCGSHCNFSSRQMTFDYASFLPLSESSKGTSLSASLFPFLPSLCLLREVLSTFGKGGGGREGGRRDGGGGGGGGGGEREGGGSKKSEKFYSTLSSSTLFS